MYYRYFLRLSYNGRNFSGWQAQSNILSVQGELEKALSAVLKEPITVIGCGRTDAGVHASMYFAHIDSARTDLHLDKEFLFRLNKSLPDAIAVDALFRTAENAHARFSAVSRSYDYHITSKKNGLTPGLTWELREELTVPAMEEAANIILQHDDFLSFSKTGNTMKTSICRITESYWRTENDHLIYRISANRFLRKMVRMLVGEMVEIGKGNKTAAQLKAALEAKQQPPVLYIAPASGLFLCDIRYPDAFQLSEER